MEDNRPIVYIARDLELLDDDNELHTVAYFVTKAHLESKKIVYSKISSNYNFHEYEVDCSEFTVETPDFGFFGESLNLIMRRPPKKVFYAFKNFKSCKDYVNKKNRELLEDYPEITNIDLINKVQEVENFNIPEEERIDTSREEKQPE